MKEELAICARIDEVKSLQKYVTDFESLTNHNIQEIKENHLLFKEDISERVDTLRIYVKDQVSECTFSVNNVARAQNALIEEKIFQLSRPTVEFEKLQREVMKIKQKNKDIISSTTKITNFFASFVGDDDGAPITLDQFVDRALQEVRDQVDNLETTQLKNEERFSKADFYFKRLFGFDENVDFHFPNWEKAEKITIDGKPKLPVCNDPATLIDYLEYLMKFAPAVQKAISAFYHQICALSNSIYDHEEKEVSFEHLQNKLDLIDQLESDVTHLKNSAISQEQIDYFTSACEELSQQKLGNDELSFVKKQLLQIKNEIVPKREIDQVLSELKEDVDHMVADAITDLKENVDFLFQDQIQNQSQYHHDSQFQPKVDDSSLPAIAAVTPRGTASHKMMYKQAPSTTRVIVPKKEEIEEVGRHNRRIQKTASRVNVPLEAIPQQTSKSALSSKRKF
ncbi:hypothetical protein TRFO_01494 [Tritrichomonas foetus]|uniref:Uncharacterized protein n=1 Tax=Tritrichomonas foetus TaxID=1144522 RepID=A0A1J4JXC7_9EUKA|nr:hypothetical protein TRFO_01494 [Tritrichomonas foetus]|eukprot:OHT03807.1 hypothetical protein TRFO_01494 [Tritrichomonas foetus]